jgi:hypothetical protein
MVSQNQILASLGTATGEKREARHVDAEEDKAIGLEKLAKGDYIAIQCLLLDILTLLVGIRKTTRIHREYNQSVSAGEGELG